MNRMLGFVYCICLGAQSNILWANDSTPVLQKSLCEVTQAKDSDGKIVTLFQHLFDGGAYDLAMYLPGGFIKRVTFGGTPLATCHYRAMALVAGGDWGWHLAWVVEGSDVLRYARMDGDAWVSSPTKKLSNNIKISTQLHIFTFEQKTWIVWGESTGTNNHIYAVHSDDEGKTWNSPHCCPR